MSDSTSKTISIRIAIDIPVDVAADTLRQLEPMLARLASVPGRVEPVADQSYEAAYSQFPDTETEEHKAAVKAHYDAQVKEFEKKAVQAFRKYRRLAPYADKPSTIYRDIASRHDWPVGVVQSIISRRRKKVMAYVKKRRLARVLRLARLGHSNQRIADGMGLSQGTVNRLLKEAQKAAAVTGGADE